MALDLEKVESVHDSSISQTWTWVNLDISDSSVGFSQDTQTGPGLGTLSAHIWTRLLSYPIRL